MLLWTAASVLAAPPAEEVCVAATRSVPAALSVAAPPASITAFRAAIAVQRAPEPVPTADLVRAIPPEPSGGGFRFHAAASPHPTDPGRALLAVQASAPDSGIAPLRLTLLLDTSDSMDSVVLRELPPLQDEGPLDRYRAVSRLRLGQAALHDLVERLPDRAVVSVVAFDRTLGTRLLGPTGIAAAHRIHDAIDRAGTGAGRGSILDLTASAATHGIDPCADNRVLLVTDANARLDVDPARVASAVEAWRAQGIELWTLSLGMLGQPAPEVAALTEAGGGVHLYADTLSEAAEQLASSLRASGAAGRDAEVVVTPDPERVRWFRRLDTGGALAGPDAWSLPETLEAGWRAVALYELELVPGAEPGPVASVRWTVGSPVPGEWTKGATVAVTPTPLAEAPALLRDRAVAVLLGEGTHDIALLDRLASPRGVAREYVAWARLLLEQVVEVDVDAG